MTMEYNVSSNYSISSNSCQEFNLINISGNCDSKGNNSEDDQIPHDALVGLIFLYSLTTFLSITGNVLVVLVFVKGRRSRTDLRLFLINLAASDLIMATFCMPFTFADSIMGHWIFTAPMCPIVLFIQIFSVCGSVFTNVAIGIDRFMAVTFPLHSRITYRRAKYVIVLVWICSFAISSVQLFIGRTFVLSGREKCNEQWPNPESRKMYTMSILFLTYLMPLLILLLTYSIVGLMLWRRTAPGNKHHERDLHQLRSKIKVVKMLVIVVVMFGICWLPLHLFNLIADYSEAFNKMSHHLVLGFFLGAHWLAMSNSFANPIIYGFTNETFRADLIILLHNWFPWSRCLRNLMTRTYSLSMYDSMIYRRTTVFHRQTSLNNNGTGKNLRLSTINGNSHRPIKSLYRVSTEYRSGHSNSAKSKFHSLHSKSPSSSTTAADY